MLFTKVFESKTDYLFEVTDDIFNIVFKYYWGKEPPEGQDLTTYLQNCKREAELLAQLEIDRKQPPMEIAI